jgi:hypothetical protein
MQEGTVDAILLTVVSTGLGSGGDRHEQREGAVTYRTTVVIFALTIELTALISGRLLGGGGVYRFAVDEIRRCHVFYRQPKRFE